VFPPFPLLKEDARQKSLTSRFFLREDSALCLFFARIFYFSSPQNKGTFSREWGLGTCWTLSLSPPSRFLGPILQQVEEGAFFFFSSTRAGGLFFPPPSPFLHRQVRDLRFLCFFFRFPPSLKALPPPPNTLVKVIIFPLHFQPGRWAKRAFFSFLGLQGGAVYFRDGTRLPFSP